MSLTKTNFQALIKLAIPLIFTGLLQSSVYFLVTIFLAHVNQNALAAGSLVAWLFGTFNIIVIGILNAINVLISYRHGAQDQNGIAEIFRDGFWLAFFLSIPAMLFFWNFAEIFALLGQPPALVELTRAYLHALCWGLLPNFITIAFMELLIGIGQTRVLLLFTTLSVSMNILFSFILILGKFGFPALGVAGAGWGTTIGFWITVLFFSIYIFTSEEYKGYTRLLFKWKKPLYHLELLKVGLPLGIMYSVEVGFFFALILIISTFGSELLAANQIALQYLSILMSVIFSIAQAITVHMGHLLGETNHTAAKNAGSVGTVICMIFMLLVALIYWIFPSLLIAVDFDVRDPNNQQLLNLSTQFLAVCAIFQIFEAMRIALFGALRALKDTRFTLYISLLCFWGIALPIGYLLATYFNLNGIGLWWGMSLSAVVSTLLLYWRFNLMMGKCK